MVYYQKMTPEGYQEIKDEIARLKKDRPRRIKILQEARSMGDLSENSEYTTAKMELGHLRYLYKQLRYSEIIQKYKSGTIDLGSNVKLLFEGDDDAEEYRIVGRMEADLAKGKISFDSPLGQALMKQKAGATVTVEAPAGSYDVKIIAVN